MAIIDTLSIRFESEAKKALTNVEGLDKSLTKLAAVVGKLSNVKINLGITDQTAKDLKSFNSAVKDIDLDLIKKFATAIGKIPKVNIGINSKTGSSLKSFSSAMKDFDYDSAKKFGDATQNFKSINLGGISEKGALGIRSFNAAIAGFDYETFSKFSEAINAIKPLNLGNISQSSAQNIRTFNDAVVGVDVDKLSAFGQAVSSFPKASIPITKSVGENIKSFADGLNNTNVDKFQQFTDVAKGFKGVKLGLGKNSGIGINQFAIAMNLIDLDALRQFADITANMQSVKTGITASLAANVERFAEALKGVDTEKLNDIVALLERLGEASSKITGITAEVRKIAGLNTLLDKAEKAVNNLNGGLRRTTRSAKGTFNIFTKLGGAVKGLFKSIGRIAFYRAIRSAIKAVTQGFSEGIKNLYHWSQIWGTTFAPAMDKLATSAKYLQNGFASMFSPLIEWAVPVVDGLVDKLVELFNFVQEGIAKMLNMPTWNRAKKIPSVFDKATESAKALKNQLMGFDELNVLNTDTKSGGEQEDYSSMFELVKTENGFANIGEALAESINSVFDNPEKFKTYGENLGKGIMKGYNATVNFVAQLDTEDMGESVGNFVSGLAGELAEQIKNTDFGEAIALLGEKISGFIDGLSKTDMIDKLKEFIASIIATIPSMILGALEAISTTISSIFSALGFDRAASKVSEWASSLAGTRKKYEASKGEALSALFNYIETGSWDPLTTRGYDYDPTQDNGRSFDSGGAVISQNEPIFHFFDDDDAGTWRIIALIIDKVKTFYDNNKDSIDGIIANIASIAEKLAPLFAALAQVMINGSLTSILNATTLVLDSLAPALTALDGVLTILDGLLGEDLTESWEGLSKLVIGFLQGIASPIVYIISLLGNLANLLASILPESGFRTKLVAYADVTKKFTDAWSSLDENFAEKVSGLGEEYAAAVNGGSSGTPSLAPDLPKPNFDASDEYVWDGGEDVFAMSDEEFAEWWDRQFGYDEHEWFLKELFARIKKWWKGLWNTDEPETGGGGDSGVSHNALTLPFKLKPPEDPETNSTLNKFWTTVKHLWGKDKWVGVKNRITEITQSVKDGWSTFKDKWGERFANISERVTNVTTAAKEGWAAFKDKWGERFANVSSRITNITSGIKDGWETFKGIWGTKRYANATSNIIGIGDSITNGWTSFINTWGNRSADVTTTLTTNTVQNKTFLDNMWKGVEKDWGNKSLWITLNAGGLTLPKPNGGGNNSLPNTFNLPVQWRARGGYLPNSYSLYGMGENGVPEILGTVGGRSAVAGGAEITGIREAIYEQGQREETLLRNLINAVNSKDLTLVANSSTGRWVNRALSAYAGVTG